MLLWTVMTHPTLIVEENDAGGITMGYKDTTDDDDAYYSGYTVGIWGVCISIVGALFTSSGLCLQKIVHKRVSADPSIGPLYKQPTYIAGIAYVVLGQLLKTLVNVLLPQSTIAPLSCQTIIYSTFFEYLFVDGEMSVKTGVSLLLSIVGIVIAMFGANFDDGEYSVTALADLFKREAAILCTALFITIIVTGRFYSNYESSFSSSTAGIIYIAFVSSLLSGWFSLSIKSALEIAKYTFLHGIKATTNVKHAFLWVLIASLPVLGFTKLRQVSYAMSVHHPLHFLPLYQSFAIIANAMCGIVYYNDFGANRVDASHVSLLKYMAGLGLVCLAVAILTHRYNSAKHFIQGMDVEEADSLLKWSYEDVDSMGNENGSFNESIGAISKTNIVNTVTSQVSVPGKKKSSSTSKSKVKRSQSATSTATPSTNLREIFSPFDEQDQDSLRIARRSYSTYTLPSGADPEVSTASQRALYVGSMSPNVKLTRQLDL